jgi:hypothetical protein
MRKPTSSSERCQSRSFERAVADLGKKRTEGVNHLHLQLSDVYTSAYETYFGKLKSPSALRFFRRFPLLQDLGGPRVLAIAVDPRGTSRKAYRGRL